MVLYVGIIKTNAFYINIVLVDVWSRKYLNGLIAQYDLNLHYKTDLRCAPKLMNVTELRKKRICNNQKVSVHSQSKGADGPDMTLVGNHVETS